MFKTSSPRSDVSPAGSIFGSAGHHAQIGKSALVDRFSEAVTSIAGIPLPGGGDTGIRFEILASLAEEDLSLARLAEGHVDALAILHESGVGIRFPGDYYGVWAARSGTGTVRAMPTASGWRLHGRKPFCSGTGVLDRAIITAEAPDGYRLFDIATGDTRITPVEDSWPAVGMADSHSETLDFAGLFVTEADAIGRPDFYTQRPGFWFGSCGVAACWFGGARGLVAGVMKTLGDDPGVVVLSELGKAASWLQAADHCLQSVADAIDSDPHDVEGRGQEQALALREFVHNCCEEILRLTATVGGARPLCHDPKQARRAADLYVYLAQHRGGTDAGRLGRLLLAGR